MEDEVLQPSSDDIVEVNEADEFMPGLSGYIKTKFDEAEKGRFSHEQRWLKAYKNFRGTYDSTTQYRDSERSRVFIKIQKVPYRCRTHSNSRRCSRICTFKNSCRRYGRTDGCPRSIRF